MAGVQRPGRLSLERSRSDDLGTFRARTCHASCNPWNCCWQSIDDQVPKLNVEATCKGSVAADKAMGLMLPQGFDKCMSDENSAQSRVHGFQREAWRIRWHFRPRRRRRSTRSAVASTPVKLARRGFWNGNGMPSPNEPLRCRFSGIQKLGNGGDQLSCRNLTSRQIDQRGRISAIRSMNHVDAISALNNSPAT